MAEAQPSRVDVAAEGPPADGVPLTDWTLLPFERTQVAPLWIGVSIAVGYMVLSLSARLWLDAEGDLAERARQLAGNPYVTMDVLNGIILAYIPTAACYLRRGLLRDLAELRPAVECTELEYERIVRQSACVPRRRLAVAGAVGASAFATMPLLDPNYWGTGPPVDVSPGLVVFHVLRGGVLGWIIGHVGLTDWWTARAFAGLGRRVRVDLLDLEPLRPFARKGMRSAFAWILSVSLVSLFWLSPAPAVTNGPIIVATIVLTLVAMMWAVSGVHRSIRDEKRRQLDELNEQIRRESERELHPEPGHISGSRLANLIAYREVVVHAREWPFDTPALLRILFFVLLGLGSWLGGALVERALDVALQ